MTKYVLQYFKVNGRVGGIRLMLDYKKVPFTDEFIEKEQWLAMKDKTPFGQIPVLIVNDGELVLPETLAIYRYLAYKHDIAPKNLEERALAEAYGEHIQDFMNKLVLFIIAKMTNQSKERQVEYLQEAVKFLHERIVPDFTKLLNKTGTGFLFGKEPTWVDFLLADTIESHRYFGEHKDDDKLGSLIQHQEKVFSLPGLEKRLEQRKQISPPVEMFKIN